MATVWIIIATFIGWFIGWAFTNEHEVICAFIGFVIALMAGFLMPIDKTED